MRKIAVIIFLVAICISFCSHTIYVSDEEPLYKIQLEGMSGYINAKGQIVITPQWIFAGDFSEGLAAVPIKKSKPSGAGEEQKLPWIGFIDKSGDVVLEPDCGYARSFSEGLAAAEKDGKYGFIDKSGEFVIPPRYDFVSEFSEGIALVAFFEPYGTLREKSYYIDREGKIISDETMYASSWFSGGLGPAGIGESPDRKFGYINIEGEFVIEPVFEYARNFSNGIAAVKMDGKWGFIDKTGDITIEPRFEDAGEFADGLCNVKLDDLWGYIDETGAFVVEPRYYDAEAFTEGMGAFTTGQTYDQKHGFVDTEGNVVIEPFFFHAEQFKNGLAWVGFKGEYGYINKDGDIIWRQSEWMRF